MQMGSGVRVWGAGFDVCRGGVLGSGVGVRGCRAGVWWFRGRSPLASKRASEGGPCS